MLLNTWTVFLNRLAKPFLRGRRRKSRVRKGQRATPLHVETLETRLMLDGTLPAIVVGRTLSAATTDAIQNHQLQITYTVYNQVGEDLTGVLLTDTLKAGVTYASASQAPDRNGATLSWNLGTIRAYGRSSVTMTVDLDNSIPLTLDDGAQAFATYAAGMVSDGTAAATLRPGSVDPVLLASTPDANIDDPYVQEQAALLDYSPQAIFAYLHSEVGYESYIGSMRGARGTLWSNAGNALDVASLGVALMRASGIPSQYGEGTLSDADATNLILSMFPRRDQVFGYIPAGTEVGDPAHDPQLLDEAKTHYYFEFDTGSGMQVADPLLPGAQVGTSFVTGAGTFTEVPDNLRQKTQVRLEVEKYSQAGAAFGGNGFSTTVVLDQTFNDVDLVGRTITVGNFVNGSGIPGLTLSALTYTYSPYLLLGDESRPDPLQDTVIRGTDFQEILTNFPLASEVLTGLFLNITQSGPDGPSQTYERTLFDRVGYAVRRNGSNGASLSVSPDAGPALNPAEFWTLGVIGGKENVRAPITNDAYLATAQQELDRLSAQNDPTLGAILNNIIVAQTRSYLESLHAASDFFNGRTADQMQVKQYFNRPRLTIISGKMDLSADKKGLTISFEADLLRDVVRVLAYPGQSTTILSVFQFQRGIEEDVLETLVFPESSTSNGLVIQKSISTTTIFHAAEQQQIPIVAISPDNPGQVELLQISAEAKIRVSRAVQSGKAVFIPSRSVTMNGKETIGWFETDISTGQTAGILENGTHGDSLIITPTMINVVLAGFAAIALYFTGPTHAFFLVNSMRPQLVLVGDKWDKDTWEKDVRNKAEVEKKIYDWFPVLGASAKGLFEESLNKSIASFLKTLDPPIQPILLASIGGISAPNQDAVEKQMSPGLSGGTVSGSVQTQSLQVQGDLQGTWDSSATTRFDLQTLNVSTGVIKDENGNIIGNGAVALNAAALLSASLSGNNHYDVNGTGTLSLYGPASTSLGVSGEWENYTATITGAVSIRLTTDGLKLNGTTLPAGTYTIETTSASLAGSGRSSTPNYSGQATLQTTNATLTVGAGDGSLTVAGQSLSTTNGVTFAGYTGALTIDGSISNLDTLTLNGNFADLLAVSGTPADLTADQNTPVQFQVQLKTSFADTYDLIIMAPKGWTVKIDDNMVATVTPAPGTQGGTFPNQIFAQSQTNSKLIAQRTVSVHVIPTAPGLTLDVKLDPLLTVPYQGANLPTGYQTIIHNDGPVAETYTVQYTNLPPGFEVLTSSTTITVQAGATTVVGFYLRPNGGTLPAPGTQGSFQVTATSTSESSRTKTVTTSFTVPAIDAIEVIATPVMVNLIPGTPGTLQVTIKNQGNVAEEVSLTAALPAGLSVSGLGNASLAPGESATLNLTFTPDAATPLNTILQARLTASYGPQANRLMQDIPLFANIVLPGALNVANAAVAALQLQNPALSNRLKDMSKFITDLFDTPDDVIKRDQLQNTLNALLGLLGNDPVLEKYAQPGEALTVARDHLVASSTPDDIKAAILEIGTALTGLAKTIEDLAQHGFLLSITPNSTVALPGADSVISIFLQNTGSRPTTYQLSVSGLPAEVSAVLSVTQVRLQAGESLTGPNTPTLTLRETGDSLFPTGFRVTATPVEAPEIAQNVSGVLTVRSELVSVTNVTPAPAFVDPGGVVAVSARILSGVNQARLGLATFIILNANQTEVFKSATTAITLTVQTSLATVDLGTFDTSGLPQGSYTIHVVLTDADGQPLSGGTGDGTFFIGSPVNATVSVDPAAVPGGNSVVKNSLHVDSQLALPNPLTLLGQLQTTPTSTAIALDGSLAYVAGTNGIDIVDVTSSSSPVLKGTFGTGDLVKGGLTLDRITTIGGIKYLVVGTTQTQNANQFTLLVYSLANPLAPQKVSGTIFDYQFMSELLVTGSSVLVPTNGVQYNLAGDVITQFGSLLSIDLSNPASPILSQVLFNSAGPPQGGETNQNGGTLVSNHLAYIASTTSVGADTQTGTGRVLVVDFSTLSNMQVVKEVMIPGTTQIVDVAIQGNRALVIGSTGGLRNPVGPNGLTGNMTFSVLDISDPLDPKLIGTTLESQVQFPSSDDGVSKISALSLGDGRFAVSEGLLHHKPVLMLVDPTDANNIVLSATQVPAIIDEMSVSGSTLYTTSAAGLFIYNLGAIVQEPVTVSVKIPHGTGVSIVADSFSIPPTQITTGIDFDTLVWKKSLTYGQSSLDVTWQSTVSDLIAGESRDVTLGTTVAYDAPAVDVSLRTVNLNGFVNGNLQGYAPDAFPAGGNTVNVGGIPFLLANFPGGGTGIVQTGAASTAAPDVIDIPVNLDDVDTVYTLINSLEGENGFTAGAVEFFGTNGAYVKFDLVEGDNIRDWFDGLHNNQITEGTPSIDFEIQGGAKIRLDRQAFVLPAAFNGNTLTLIRLSGYGTPPQGEPFLAGISIATTNPTAAGSGNLVLAPTTVHSEHVISMDPGAQMAQPGATTSFDVLLTNPTDQAVVYTLSVQGLAAGWVGWGAGSSPTVEVPPQSSVHASLLLTPDNFAALETRGFVVIATGDNGSRDAVEGRLTIAGEPANIVPAESRGIVATLSPSLAELGQGTSAVYTLRLTNTGSAADTIQLSTLNLPSGVIANFGDGNSLSLIDILPGAGNYIDIPVILTAFQPTLPGDTLFAVVAQSTLNPAVNATAESTLHVQSAGVGVSISPTEGMAGETYAVTVTNLGDQEDTFTLSLGDAGALIATLGASEVTLAPGASQTIDIQTIAATFAFPGKLQLTVKATSQRSPSVASQASADLNVVPTQGISSEFTPDTKLIPIPGTTSFILLVKNTGNTEEEFAATILGTTGPITANISGLDGLVSLDLNGFRIPGLGTAALIVKVDLNEIGRGTVTVKVNSLASEEQASTATATIATAPVPVIQVTSGSFNYDGNPRAATGTMSSPTGEDLGAPTLTYTDSENHVSSQPPVNAGTYTVTASFAGDETYAATSVTATLTILQATPVIALEDGVVTYDGEGHSLSGTVKGVNLENLGPLTYMYTDANDMATTEPPVTAGVYTVTASYAATGNYKGISKTASLTIQQAQPTVNVTGGTFTQDGQAHPAVGSVVGVNGQDLGTPELTYTDVDQHVSSVPPTLPGTYLVTAHYSGNANYVSATATTTVTINPTNSDASIVLTPPERDVQTRHHHQKRPGKKIKVIVNGPASLPNGQVHADINNSTEQMRLKLRQRNGITIKKSGEQKLVRFHREQVGVLGGTTDHLEVELTEGVTVQAVQAMLRAMKLRAAGNQPDPVNTQFQVTDGNGVQSNVAKRVVMFRHRK